MDRVRRTRELVRGTTMRHRASAYGKLLIANLHMCVK